MVVSPIVCTLGAWLFVILKESSYLDPATPTMILVLLRKGLRVREGDKGTKQLQTQIIEQAKLSQLDQRTAYTNRIGKRTWLLAYLW